METVNLKELHGLLQDMFGKDLHTDRSGKGVRVKFKKHDGFDNKAPERIKKLLETAFVVRTMTKEEQKARSERRTENLKRTLSAANVGELMTRFGAGKRHQTRGVDCAIRAQERSEIDAGTLKRSALK